MMRSRIRRSGVLRSMTERVACVTGAGGTIGRAICRRLAKEGWQVVLLDRDEGRAKSLAAELGGLFLQTDVADEAQVERAFAEVADVYGRLDALVNNAAIADPSSAPLRELKLADWHAQLAVNLDGPLLCTKHALDLLEVSKGAVVHISSTRAFMSEANTYAYSASKGAIEALTHAMAISLGPEVRVNAIAPGWIADEDAELRDIDHQAHPAGRVGRGEDIAGAVLYLVGESAFVTGATLVVDGGMTKKMMYPE